MKFDIKVVTSGQSWGIGGLALAMTLLAACATSSAPATPSPIAPASPTPQPTATLADGGLTPTAAPVTATPASTSSPLPTSTVQPTAAPTSMAANARSEVRIVLAAEPPSLDTFTTSGSEHSTIYRENMTDLLSWIDKDTKQAVPLSGFTGWEQQAIDRWRFSIREGVKFHNGEIFDAAAAAVSINIQGDPAKATDSFSDTGVITGEVVDPLTVDVVCGAPCPIFPYAAKALGFQAPKWYTENSETETKGNTVGLGPYRLADWRHGIALRLEAYPDYVPNPQTAEARAPVIPNVTYYFREESAVRAAMVKTGEADLANNITLGDKDNVPEFHRTNSGLWPFLGFDTIWNPTLKNVKVRQALAYGWDCAEVVKTVLLDTTVCRGNVGFPEVRGLTEENLQPFEHNPALAKQLLAEAGYNGEKIRIASRSIAYQSQGDVMEAIANYWMDLGVNVELQFMESGVHRDLRNCGIGRVGGDVTREPADCDHGDIYETSADLSSLDYSRLFYGWLSCPSPTSRVCEPRIEDLGMRAIAASGEERQQLLAELAGVVREEVLLLSLFDGVLFVGKSADLDWEPRGIDRKIRVNMMSWK